MAAILDDDTEDELTAANIAIQDFVSVHGEGLPVDLIKLIADLDWIIRNI